MNPDYNQTSQQHDINEPPQNPVEQEYDRRAGMERPKGLHPMVVLQPGERVVCMVKRHPIGIISLYFSGLVAIAIIAAVVFFLMPSLSNQYNLGDYRSMVYVGGIGLAVLMILVLGVATVIYWENQWVVTTDSITQISQNSLFNRQVAQLSMENLEDVTVNQDGIFPHLFNYGNLKVETAGERSKFVFPYCPNPNQCARQILEVHEDFLEERRNIQNR